MSINADSRVTAAAEFLALFGDLPELRIALGVRLSRVQRSAVAWLAVLLFAQQPADRRWTGAVILLL